MVFEKKFILFDIRPNVEKIWMKGGKSMSYIQYKYIN